MKALLIGGTGTISMAISRQLLAEGWDLTLLNRGGRNQELPDCKTICADIYDEARVNEAVKDMSFDVVADFIAFTPREVERDYRLFAGKTGQYIFISSASAYQKPLSDYRITESTPLCNPYWQYSRNKIACEESLMKMYREQGFPVTIVRPSHTYDERSVPLGLHGNGGSWQVIKRMMEGKPVIIHGDGSSLWTLTHNRDFAKGFIGLMGNLHAIGEAVQITSDESLTWNQIYTCVADALGVKLNPFYVSTAFLCQCAKDKYDLTGSLLGDKANTVVFDNSKLKRLVPAFCASIRADQGIRQAVDYILAHPQYQKEDTEFDIWCDKVITSLRQAAESFPF